MTHHATISDHVAYRPGDGAPLVLPLGPVEVDLTADTATRSWTADNGAPGLTAIPLTQYNDYVRQKSPQADQCGTGVSTNSASPAVALCHRSSPRTWVMPIPCIQDFRPSGTMKSGEPPACCDSAKTELRSRWSQWLWEITATSMRGSSASDRPGGCTRLARQSKLKAKNLKPCNPL